MPDVMKHTWDDQRLKRDRVAQLQEQMKLRDIGALYLTSGITVRYVLNTPVPAGEAFVPVEGEALGIVRPRDTAYVKARHPNIKLPFYTPSAITDGSSPDEANKFAQGIMEMMEQHGVAGEQLGVDGLSATSLMALVRAEIHIADATPVWERAQSVKTQDEVAIYRNIGEQHCYAITAFRDAVRPGITEKELARVVIGAWYDADGEDILQLNICAGENMNPWLRWPSDRKLKEGEFVAVDLHGTGTNGLRGDASRTYLVGSGQPTTEQRDLYRRAYDYLLGASDAFQAGRSFQEVIAAVPPVEDKYQVMLGTLGIGHGVGMGTPGYPHIGKGRRLTPSDHVIEANQVVAIECLFGEVGNPMAVKLEEMILPRSGSPEVLGGSGIPFDARFVP